MKKIRVFDTEEKAVLFIARLEGLDEDDAPGGYGGDGVHHTLGMYLIEKDLSGKFTVYWCD